MKNKKMQSRGNEVLDTYKIDITPDKSLYQKMGEGGHNFYECNAEFIDNSIDAMTPKQKDGKEQLRIDIVINAKKKFYSITDNGVGMDKKTAMLAATLGKSLKTQKDLGSFGFGLKSGAMSIGDNFIVKTGMEENDYMTEVHYNHSEWTSNPNWTLPAKDLKKEIGEHGTSIIINKVTNIELNAETLRLKPETKVKYEETKKALLDCFGDRAIYAQEIPNEYCDCYQCKQTSPWFMVTTTRGMIKIGWRKRVINIDWSTMNREDAETLFPDEDVTKDGRLIHAWGYEKAKEYLNKLLA